MGEYDKPRAVQDDEEEGAPTPQANPFVAAAIAAVLAENTNSPTPTPTPAYLPESTSPELSSPLIDAIGSLAWPVAREVVHNTNGDGAPWYSVVSSPWAGSGFVYDQGDENILDIGNLFGARTAYAHHTSNHLGQGPPDRYSPWATSTPRPTNTRFPTPDTTKTREAARARLEQRATERAEDWAEIHPTFTPRPTNTVYVTRTPTPTSTKVPSTTPTTTPTAWLPEWLGGPQGATPTPSATRTPRSWLDSPGIIDAKAARREDLDIIYAIGRMLFGPQADGWVDAILERLGANTNPSTPNVRKVQ